MIDARRLTEVLTDAGQSWRQLTEAASEIVVFGSQAAGCADEASDWDLLCIGAGGPNVHTGDLDLIWRTHADVRSERWLTSELAGHVAAYGVWLHGEPDWTRHVRITQETVDRKRQVVRARFRAAALFWPRFSDRRRSYYRDKLRRDLQRIALMARGEPVAPGAHLDAAWARSPDPQALSRHAGVEDPGLIALLAAETPNALSEALSLSPPTAGAGCH